MESEFLLVLMAAAEGRVALEQLRSALGPGGGEVFASAGYPGVYETGQPICGIAEAEATGAGCIHAGSGGEGSDGLRPRAEGGRGDRSGRRSRCSDQKRVQGGIEDRFPGGCITGQI